MLAIRTTYFCSMHPFFFNIKNIHWAIDEEPTSGDVSSLWSDMFSPVSFFWQLHGFWLHPDVSGKYKHVILVQLRMGDSPLQLWLQLQLFLTESSINHRRLAVNILTKATRLHHKLGKMYVPLIRSCCSTAKSSKTSVRENFKQISTFCLPQKWAVSRCLKSPHNPERFLSFLIKSPLNIYHTLAQPWGN